MTSKIKDYLMDTEDCIDPHDESIEWSHQNEIKYYFDVFDIEYSITDEMIIDARKKSQMIKKIKRDDIVEKYTDDLHKIYLLTNGDISVYATSRYSVLYSLKCSLHDVINEKSNYSLGHFKDLLKVTVKLVGYAIGNLNKNDKEELYKKHNPEYIKYNSKSITAENNNLDINVSSNNVKRKKNDVKPKNNSEEKKIIVKKNNINNAVCEKNTQKTNKIDSIDTTKSSDIVTSVKNDNLTSITCEKLVDKKKLRKNEKNKEKIDEICNKIFAILDLDENNIKSRIQGDYFIIDAISTDKQKQIMDLKNDCEQNFAKKNWAVFYGKTNEPWLSLIRCVMIACNYNVDRGNINYHSKPKRIFCIKKMSD